MGVNPSCTTLQSREGHGSSDNCLEESSMSLEIMAILSHMGGFQYIFSDGSSIMLVYVEFSS